ncbi:hypothetical protein BJ170DRAFT_616709 [Xylariales sp. AK1849]|nr:hypothetical protein BJ170DRAFT_616709 [Xylariales sp. AK1849]
MFSSKIAILAAFAALSIGHVAATATNPYAACQGPNNGKHGYGDSCAYLDGPSTSANVFNGQCGTTSGNGLKCFTSFKKA